MLNRKIFELAISDIGFINDSEDTLKDQFFIPKVKFPTKEIHEDLEVSCFNSLYIWYLVWKGKYNEVEFIKSLNK